MSTASHSSEFRAVVPRISSLDAPSGASDAGIPTAFHAFAAAVFVAALGVANLAPRGWMPLVTAEDGVLEWLTVAFFALAGVRILVIARRERRIFDALVGLFCLVVAGEEMSWGQRLLGITPPDYFLENNRQQELNFHNFGNPRAEFSAALIGFGLLLPLAARWAPLARLMEKVGATAPFVALAPWIAAAVLLNQWDPHKVTAEWAELLGGAIFLASTWRPVRPKGGAPDGGEAGGGDPMFGRRLPTALGAVAAALVLTGASAVRAGDGEVLACAQAEADALAHDIAEVAATDRLRGAGSLVAMVRQADRQGDVRLARATGSQQVRCGSTVSVSDRRRFAVDPWGVAYWLSLRDEGGQRLVSVYSLGPNRRLDGLPGVGGGDDIVRVVPLQPAVASR